MLREVTRHQCITDQLVEVAIGESKVEMVNTVSLLCVGESRFPETETIVSSEPAEASAPVLRVRRRVPFGAWSDPIASAAPLGSMEGLQDWEAKHLALAGPAAVPARADGVVNWTGKGLVAS
jgi:hypothetical protein